MKDKKKAVVGISAVLILIGFVIAAYTYSNLQKKKLGFLAAENAQTFVRSYSPTMGPEDAKVYLVEFLDPECESCRRFYPVVKDLMKEFAPDIRLVIRYVPFHGNSKFAIALLEASRKQNRFWEVLHIIFQTQPAWGSHHNPQPEKLWGFLPAVDGLDIEKLKEDMKDPGIADIINQDMADAQTLGVRATPTFFVNGTKLTQFGVEPLKAMIRNELNK